MAQIILQKDEPKKLVSLVEQLFQTKLEAVDKVLDGVSITGNVTVVKQIAATVDAPATSLSVQVTINP